MLRSLRSLVALTGIAAAVTAALAQPAPIVVEAGAAPALAVALTPMADGGWTLTLTVERFAMVEGTGGNVVGEGHATVTIDGAAPVALHALEYIVPPLSRGLHTIDVALVARDGAPYATNAGQRIAERFAIDVDRAPFGVPRLVPLDLVGTAVAGGDVVRAEQGETLALRWTVDQEQELHLHGYDIEVEVTPEFPTTMIFVATAAGRFPTERHAAAGGEATVLYLEVLP